MNLREGHILLSLQVELRGEGVAPALSLNGARVGLDVDHVPNLRMIGVMTNQSPMPNRSTITAILTNRHLYTTTVSTGPTSTLSFWRAS